MRRVRVVLDQGRLAVAAIAGAAALLVAAPTASANTCPCSLFAGTVPAEGAAGGFELGVRFEVTAPSAVTAIRFWKAAGETGSHIGRIWSPGGTELAQTAFAGETSSGWQEQDLETPVTLIPGSVYVVSVGINAHYVATIDGLLGQVTSPPLRTAAGPNGVYATNGDFPTSTWLAQNYFVDVVATPLPPLETIPTPVDGATGLPPSLAPSVTFSRAMDAASVLAGFSLERAGSGPVAATASYDAATRTARLVPSTPLLPGVTYTARLQASVADADGVGLPGPISWSFVTGPLASATDSTPPPAEVTQHNVAGTTADASPRVVPFPLDELTVSIVRTPSWRTVATSSRRTWVAISAAGIKPKRMQLATDVARPWAWRSYLSAFSFRTRTPAIWARFAQTDDTVTSWHRISLASRRR